MTGFLPTPMLSDAAAVGVGAVCGALCRHQIGKLAAEQIAKDTSGRLKAYTGWHTAGINVLGSFLLGGIFAAPITAPAEKMTASPPSALSKPTSVITLPPRAKLLLGVGFCGSFTTFSTFSVDVVNMMSKGDMPKAFAYVMTNNVGGFMAAAAGMMAMKMICKI